MVKLIYIKVLEKLASRVRTRARTSWVGEEVNRRRGEVARVAGLIGDRRQAKPSISFWGLATKFSRRNRSGRSETDPREFGSGPKYFPGRGDFRAYTRTYI